MTTKRFSLPVSPPAQAAGDRTDARRAKRLRKRRPWSDACPNRMRSVRCTGSCGFAWAFSSTRVKTMKRKRRTTKRRGIGYGGVAGASNESWKWRQELCSLASRFSSRQASILSPLSSSISQTRVHMGIKQYFLKYIYTFQCVKNSFRKCLFEYLKNYVQ